MNKIGKKSLDTHISLYSAQSNYNNRIPVAGWACYCRSELKQNLKAFDIDLELNQLKLYNG